MFHDWPSNDGYIKFSQLPLWVKLQVIATVLSTRYVNDNPPCYQVYIQIFRIFNRFMTAYITLIGDVRIKLNNIMSHIVIYRNNLLRTIGAGEVVGVAS